LYQNCNLEKGVPFTREDLEKRKPLRATSDPKTAVYYWIKLENTDYCVKAFAVETDRTVPVVKDEACRTRVAGRPPRTGAVRGVGEGCSDGDDVGGGGPTAGSGVGPPLGPPAGTPG
jgi:hypothetical protein